MLCVFMIEMNCIFIKDYIQGTTAQSQSRTMEEYEYLQPNRSAINLSSLWLYTDRYAGGIDDHRMNIRRSEGVSVCKRIRTDNTLA